MFMALTISILTAGAVYMIQQRGMVRLVFGMMMFGHAANLTLLAAGVGAWRGEAFPSTTAMEDMADPLPQAFVLTAIVISMATATILLMLAALGRDDDTVYGNRYDYQGPSPLSTAGRTARVKEDKA